MLMGGQEEYLLQLAQLTRVWNQLLGANQCSLAAVSVAVATVS